MNLAMLPKVDDRLCLGTWESFPIARPVIKSEQKYAVNWYAGTYMKKGGKGRQFPSSDHNGKLIPNKSLCLVAEYVHCGITVK